jgi:hypothetical protein
MLKNHTIGASIAAGLTSRHPLGCVVRLIYHLKLAHNGYVGGIRNHAKIFNRHYTPRYCRQIATSSYVFAFCLFPSSSQHLIALHFSRYLFRARICERSIFGAFHLLNAVSRSFVSHASQHRPAYRRHPPSDLRARLQIIPAFSLGQKATKFLL